MNIDSLTIAEARQIATMFGGGRSGGTHSFEVGRAYLIRATHHHIGRIVAITDTDILMADGGWLAESGRFNECLAKGVINEFEAAPAGMTWLVSRSDIIDAWPWNHAIPTTQ